MASSGPNSPLSVARAAAVGSIHDAARLVRFVGAFFGMDMAASSARTRALLGWEPTGPTLLDDIAAGAYSGVG